LTKGPIPTQAPDHAEIWLDGGHNEDCGRVLAQAMADFEDKVQRPLVLVCGTLATKDTGAILRAFKGLAQEVLAVPVNGEHMARAPGDIVRLANAEGIPAVACDGFEHALQYLAARQWIVPPRILITGSLYLAGEILRLNGTPPT
jgi:dihydrofolate synthase / folylpolyglutamate synthase